MRWRLWWVAFALVLAVPLAEAMPGEGDVKVDGVVRLPGESRVLLEDDVALVAVPDAGGLVAFDALAGSLSLEIIRWKEDAVENPLTAPVRARSAFESERRAFRDVTVSVRDVPDGAVVALLGEGLKASTLTLTDARLSGVATAIVYPGLQSGGASTEGTGGEALEVANTVESSADRLVASLDGGFVLRLDGAAVEVTSGGKTERFESGSQTTASSPTASTTTNTLLILTGSGHADLRAAGGRLAAYTLAPIEAAKFEAEATHGRFLVDGERYDLDGDALGLGGAMRLRLRAGDGPAVRDEYGVARTASLRAAIAGDFDRVSVASATTRVLPAAAAGGLLGLVALAAVAWYWPLLKYGLTAAYTRLKEPDLLDNQVRGAIFRIIKEKPGIAARSIHRESGQSWGTVVYHLRQLERHRLVKSCRVGRFRTFYESNGRYNGLEDGYAVLHNDKTRSVARIIAANPGLTQEQLTRAVQLPQSTVSYYVRKLKQSRLVEERRNGKYAAYFPGPALTSTLAGVGHDEPAASAVVTATPLVG